MWVTFIFSFSLKGRFCIIWYVNLRLSENNVDSLSFNMQQAHVLPREITGVQFSLSNHVFFLTADEISPSEFTNNAQAASSPGLAHFYHLLWLNDGL